MALQHRFWMLLLLFLLTWPACEVSQEIGTTISRKMQSSWLHQAEELWNHRPFDEYQVSIRPGTKCQPASILANSL
jgi:hypothetical protein